VALLYAGCLVERASTRALFAAPAHPYARALLAQIPRADRLADVVAEPEGLMPVLREPPRACPFRARCPDRMPLCDEAMPALRRVAPDHVVACHLYS
jgi:oligopeptide/dipeptide ABC transporter ATP-binding protein